MYATALCARLEDGQTVKFEDLKFCGVARNKSPRRHKFELGDLNDIIEIYNIRWCHFCQSYEYTLWHRTSHGGGYEEHLHEDALIKKYGEPEPKIGPTCAGEERLKKWEAKFGPIPEDATHICLMDYLIEEDLMKEDNCGLRYPWHYARRDGEWVQGVGASNKDFTNPKEFYKIPPKDARPGGDRLKELGRGYSCVTDVKRVREGKVESWGGLCWHLPKEFYKIPQLPKGIRYIGKKCEEKHGCEQTKEEIKIETEVQTSKGESMYNLIKNSVQAQLKVIAGWAMLAVVLVVALVVVSGVYSAISTAKTYGLRGATAPIVDAGASAGSAIWYGSAGKEAVLPSDCVITQGYAKCGDQTYRLAQ